MAGCAVCLHKNVHPNVCSDCLGGTHFNQRKKTNADRIRAMSDEELIDFFERMMGTLIPWCDHPCPNGEDSICRSCVVEWLKEEAKGDTDEDKA